MFSGLERSDKVLIDHLERACIGIVDADLLGRQRMLQNIDLDALVGQGAGGIETKRFQIASEHLHGGDAAGLDGLNKVRRVANGKSAPPHRLRRCA